MPKTGKEAETRTRSTRPRKRGLGRWDQLVVVKGSDGVPPRRYRVSSWSRRRLERKRQYAQRLAMTEVELDTLHQHRTPQNAIQRLVAHLTLSDLRGHMPFGVFELDGRRPNRGKSRR